MRAGPFVLAAGLAFLSAAPAMAARPALAPLPSAVAAATPGTGSAPVLSAGLAGADAVAAVASRRPARRPRGARVDTRPF